MPSANLSVASVVGAICAESINRRGGAGGGSGACAGPYLPNAVGSCAVVTTCFCGVFWSELAMQEAVVCGVIRVQGPGHKF